jgi:hypothetical protein
MGRASRRKRDRRAGRLPPVHWNPETVQKLPEPAVPHVERRKISAALLELVDPYLDDAPELDQVRSLAGLGTLAWNLSLLPMSERSRRIREVAQDSKVPDREALTEILQHLVQRKIDLFPDDTRRIFDWEVREEGDIFHLTAMGAG